MSKTKPTKKIYEMAILISPEFSQEEAKNLYENLNGFLQEKGGILIDFFPPRMINLAYKIKKRERAYLSSTTFQLRVENIKEIEKKLKEEEKKKKGILRYLIFSKS